METHSNRILVALVVALTLAAVVAFALWLTAASRTSGREYDVVLERSVSGLVVGSPVTFSGVPVGRVMSIDLDPAQAGRIRVRIALNRDDVPITEGTVAHLEGDLMFGTALVTLEQAETGGEPLVARPGEEVPVIPVEGSGLAALASDPTPMIESIAYATDRLLKATAPEEQKRISAQLDEMVRSTGELAARGPEMSRAIANARAAIRGGAAMSASMGQQAVVTRRNLEARAPAQIRELRSSLAAARSATETLNARIDAVRPRIAEASETAAGVQQQVRDAREGVAAMTETAKALDAGGSPLSGPPTPDYEPESR